MAVRKELNCVEAVREKSNLKNGERREIKKSLKMMRKEEMTVEKVLNYIKAERKRAT